MKTLGPVKYLVSGTTVYMWMVNAPEGTPPFLEQTFHPHNRPFAGTEDAEAWAVEYITNTYNIQE